MCINEKKGNAEQDVFVYVYFCVIMLLFFVVVVLWVFCLFVCLFVCLFFFVFFCGRLKVLELCT